MELVNRPNTESVKPDNQWDILTHKEDDEGFFSEEASAERMNQYLSSINADDFMSVVRGYRKHLNDFRQRLSEKRFKEKYDDNPDLLNVYAFSGLVKDYLSKQLEITGLDLEIKQKEYNNTEGGHLNIKDGKIYINFDYNRRGTLGDIAKVIAHEMWHAKQALSSFEMSENGSTNKTPYFDALFANYQESSSEYEGYYNQAVEKEARAFADAFERKIFSDNPSYETWMQERYCFSAEYYGRLATDKYFDSLNDWDEYDD